MQPFATAASCHPPLMTYQVTASKNGAAEGFGNPPAFFDSSAWQ
ncbi:hypothetical protein [Streptomyces griseorubiginosus]|nr:hypothetical protein [Streptomyces griseorubiginosus]WUB45402.1 hypothetical protein OHN19_19430 [Streptomyces griseorubiginosus]WUB53920.1 hypothetical protein OG942_19430 [Streptomyces griseorubiginosus]